MGTRASSTRRTSPEDGRQKVLDVLSLSKMERLQTLDPRRKVEVRLRRPARCIDDVILGLSVKLQMGRLGHGGTTVIGGLSLANASRCVRRSEARIPCGRAKPQMARCRRGGGTVTSWRPLRTADQSSNGVRAQILFEAANPQTTRCCRIGSTVFSSVLVLRERDRGRGGGRAHQFAALHVVHDRDPGAGVAEEFCGEFDAGVGVDRGGNGAAEHVRGHPVDPCSLEHLSQLPAHIRRGQRGAVPELEQQVIQAHTSDLGEPPADRVGGERRDSDNASRLGRLGMLLPERLLALAADKGSGQANAGTRLVMSTSRRRMAMTSPIRAEVPSITSMIAPSWPSSLGPEMWSTALSTGRSRRGSH
jgi:hypothetical protein